MPQVQVWWACASALSIAMLIPQTALAQVEHAAAPRPSLPQFDDCRLELDQHTGCGKACVMRRLWEQQHGYPTDQAEGGAQNGGGVLRGVIDTTDLLHCDLAIEIFPNTQTLSGTNVMTLVSLADGLTSFAFRLREQFVISSCTVTDSVGSYPVVPTAPGANSYGRTINFLRPINEGEQFTVSITYSGVAVSRGFGSITFATQAGIPLVSTLSEPYYAATWWPCKDGDFQQPGDNGDKFTMDFAITTPSNLRAVANGLPQGVDDLSGSRRRYRWASGYPVSTYLVAFSATNYNTWTVNYTHGAVDMPVEFNIYPQSDTAPNRAAWELCVPMLHAFRPLFGEYPFVAEKYGIYQFPFNGGMEHQTNTGQGTFNESVTAHELGHQWWGDMVTCKTWHDIWLNEGLATYSEALWFENKPGSSGLPALHNHMANRRPGSVNGTVYCYDVSDPNRIFSSNFTYNKGGWVFHMLRGVVGDETFFNILAEHRTRHEYSAATTDDFIAAASDAAGQDLSWFFEPWVYQPGAPTYTYGWQASVISGEPYLRLRVRQTQSSSYPRFAMPIEVRVTTNAGVESHRIFNDAATQHYLLPLNAPPTAVEIDPDNWILNEGKSLVAYVAGPPKIVTLAPAPGAEFEHDQAPAAITVTFSDNVNANQNHFSLVGENGPISLPAPQNLGSNTFSLALPPSLDPGVYTVTISDTITAAVGGLALDGELTDPASGPLPSGNGLPGGSAVYTFSVLGNPCTVDLNGSGNADVPDIFEYLSLWFASDPAADIDGVPGVAVPDIFAFLSLWFAGC